MLMILNAPHCLPPHACMQPAAARRLHPDAAAAAAAGGAALPKQQQQQQQGVDHHSHTRKQLSASSKATSSRLASKQPPQQQQIKSTPLQFIFHSFLNESGMFSSAEEDRMLDTAEQAGNILEGALKVCREG